MITLNRLILSSPPLPAAQQRRKTRSSGSLSSLSEAQYRPCTAENSREMSSRLVLGALHACKQRGPAPQRGRLALSHELFGQHVARLEGDVAAHGRQEPLPVEGGLQVGGERMHVRESITQGKGGDLKRPSDTACPTRPHIKRAQLSFFQQRSTPASDRQGGSCLPRRGRPCPRRPRWAAGTAAPESRACRPGTSRTAPLRRGQSGRQPRRRVSGRGFESRIQMLRAELVAQ